MKNMIGKNISIPIAPKIKLVVLIWSSKSNYNNIQENKKKLFFLEYLTFEGFGNGCFPWKKTDQNYKKKKVLKITM